MVNCTRLESVSRKASQVRVLSPPQNLLHWSPFGKLINQFVQVANLPHQRLFDFFDTHATNYPFDQAKLRIECGPCARLWPRSWLRDGVRCMAVPKLVPSRLWETLILLRPKLMPGIVGVGFTLTHHFVVIDSVGLQSINFNLVVFDFFNILHILAVVV